LEKEGKKKQFLGSNTNLSEIPTCPKSFDAYFRQAEDSKTSFKLFLIF
jgi:hypothetical protein